MTPEQLSIIRLQAAADFLDGKGLPMEWSSSDIRNVLSHIDTLTAERDALKADNVELERLFDLQHKRMVEATALWQAATGSKNLPDLGSLLTWLMNRSDMIMAERDALRVERDDADAKADDAIFVAHNVIERCAGLAAEVQFLGVAVTNNDPKEEIALRVKDIHLGLAALAQTKETT